MPLRRRLVIVGADAFGKEVWHWSNDVPSNSKNWDSVVFINDEIKNAQIELYNANISCLIVSTIDDYVPQCNDVCICSIVNPKRKLDIVEQLEGKGVKFTNIIHPTAIIGNGCRLGTGIILCPYTVLTVNVSVDNHVIIDKTSSIGHDAKIGEGVTIGSHCDITGYCEIQRGSLIGEGTSTLPKSIVEENSVVCAGSVVLKKVRANRVVMGNPAYYVDRIVN
ncbi:hypothetical protein J7E73_21250 [Paenibacillus albidus]|uniref:hypothetical protein n=1 Tax=Paenibacillus albidus TaxID=2041023 RepID=UPI001BE90F1D|nr:hypothetical protein [Paenibacillus albidus]MBT2291606.1 hypothetical protein [Paenibacillus albidus]